MQRAAPAGLVGGVLMVAAAYGQQLPPAETQIRIEVWNGVAWTDSVNVEPRTRVEYRVVVDYAGARTDLLGLQSSVYQVSVSNADNSGASRDEMVPFPFGGFSGFTRPTTILNTVDGANGAALPVYGRVSYAGQAQWNVLQNSLTVFRHGGDFVQAGAPAGAWLRVAGSYVSEWPSLVDGQEPTAHDLNLITRGISAGQRPPIDILTGEVNSAYISGTQQLVVFRHAMILSDLDLDRTLELSIPTSSLLRETTGPNGGFSLNNERYVVWTQNVAGTANQYRSAVAITPATVVVGTNLPSAGVVSIFAISTVVALRRRRR